MQKRALPWFCGWKRSLRDGPQRWKLILRKFLDPHLHGYSMALAFALNCFVLAYNQVLQMVFKSISIRQAAQKSSKQMPCEII